MAEPHSDTHSDKNAAERARETQRAAPRGEPGRSDLQAERRSFGEAGGAVARGTERTTEVRQFGEASPAAGARMIELWREAFNPIFAAQMETQRWIDQLWRQTTGLPGVMGLASAQRLMPGPAFGPLTAGPVFGLPPSDVKETPESYELRVELPGVSREDIDLQINGDVLSLCGRKAEEKGEALGAYRVSERRFGQFERDFPIPTDVRREQIQAVHADGVLKVTLPKSEELRRQANRVPIR